MPELLLSDPETFPSEKVIFSHIGRTKPLWKAFFAQLGGRYPTAAPEWRYYRDGKSWLLKVTKKTKTLCWVSLLPGSFRVTFYFADKAASPIAESDLPADLKEQFTQGKHYGKIRALTVHVQRKEDLDSVATLLALKDRF